MHSENKKYTPLLYLPVSAPSSISFCLFVDRVVRRYKMAAGWKHISGRRRPSHCFHAYLDEDETEAAEGDQGGERERHGRDGREGRSIAIGDGEWAGLKVWNARPPPRYLVGFICCLFVFV